MNPKQLKDKLEKLKVLYQKENDKLIEHQENVDRLKCSIEYISGLSKIKPQIIYNSGRDKKYIYGQIYYFVEPQSPKKKSFRFSYHFRI